MVIPQIGKIRLADFAWLMLFAVGQKDTPAAKGVIHQNAPAVFQHMPRVEAVVSTLGHENETSILLNLQYRIIELQNTGRNSARFREKFQKKQLKAFCILINRQYFPV